MTQNQFENCFKTYYKQLVVFAYKFVQRQDIAEDIVQQVFLNVWEHLEKLDMDKGILAYLYQSTRNRCLNHLRSSYQSVVVHDADQAVNHPAAASNSIETKELYIQIQEAILELPDKCREVFLLSREHSMTYKQIAASLNISIKTVENQMGKALKHLYSRFGDRLGMILILFFLKA